MRLRKRRQYKESAGQHHEEDPQETESARIMEKQRGTTGKRRNERANRDARTERAATYCNAKSRSKRRKREKAKKNTPHEMKPERKGRNRGMKKQVGSL